MHTNLIPGKFSFLMCVYLLRVTIADVGINTTPLDAIAPDCPVPCHCRFAQESHRLNVDCSKSPIGSIPSDIPPDTNVLDLRNTNLSHVPPGAFRHLRHLNTLYLGSNRIARFNNESFACLTALEHLDLSPVFVGMNISYESFPPSLFRDLLQLKVLRIGEMISGTQIQRDYIDRTMAPLQQLEQLFLPHAPYGNITLGPGYSNLTSLKTLTFNGRHSAGGTTLHKDAFVWLKNNPIERLAFIRCGIDSLDPGTMMAFPRLKVLDLECGNFLTVRNAEEFICDLRHTSIETLRMNGIFERINGVGFVQTWTISNSFYCLKHQSLKSLELLSNKIEGFDLSNLNYLSHLKYIDLSDNNIFALLQNGTDRIKTLTPATLYVLYPSINNIKFFKMDANAVNRFNGGAPCKLSYSFWHGHPKMPSPYESHSEGQSKRAQGSTSGTEINTRMPMPVLRFSLPENLEYLSLSYWPGVHFYRKYKIQCGHTHSTFFYGNNLRYLNLASIGVKITCNELFGLDKLEYLDLSKNDNYFLAKNFFNRFPSLRYLTLEKNNLGDLIAGGLIALKIPLLETLNLASNDIKSIPQDFFSYLPSLRHLNLRRNRITTLSFDMANLISIKVVDLGDNLLQAFSSKELELIEIKNSRSDFVLNMQNNPVVCTSCEGEAFVRWLLSTSVAVTFSKNSACSVNGTKSLLQNTLTKLQTECDNNQMNRWTSLGVSLAVLVGLASGLVVIYIYRWHIKYRLYILRRRLGRRGLLVTPPGHVYISYDDKDNNWVINELLRHLEDDKGLDVIIDQRDFIGGASLAEAIVEAVDNSRKTVLVLSESYVLNPWCEFEFQMSLVRGYYSLIPVMFQPVPFDIMPKSLRMYIKARGYIKWTNSREGQHLFWKRLTDVIISVDNHAIQTDNDDEDNP